LQGGEFPVIRCTAVTFFLKKDIAWGWKILPCPELFCFGYLAPRRQDKYLDGFDLPQETVRTKSTEVSSLHRGGEQGKIQVHGVASERVQAGWRCVCNPELAPATFQQFFVSQEVNFTLRLVCGLSIILRGGIIKAVKGKCSLRVNILKGRKPCGILAFVLIETMLMAKPRQRTEESKQGNPTKFDRADG